MSLLWVKRFRFGLVILNVRMPENCKSDYFAFSSALVIEIMEMRSYLPPFFRRRKGGEVNSSLSGSNNNMGGEGNSSFLFCISCLFNFLSAKRLLPTCKLILTIGIIVISYSIVLCCVMLWCVVLYRLVLYCIVLYCIVLY